MSDQDRPNAADDGVSRRSFVKGASAAGIAAGLAGCGGQSAVETDEPSGDGSGDGGDGEDDTPTETQTPVQVGSEALQTIQELAYVTNQTLPVLPLQEKLAQSFQTTDDWKVPDTDSDDLQTYWPTEWGPRDGYWTRKEGADDERLTLAQWTVPKDSQYNPWNGKNYAEGRRVLFDRFMKYNLANAEFSGYVIEDWSIEGTTVTLTLRDGQMWHDGTEVVARDVADQLKLDMYTGGALGDFVAPEDTGNIADRVTVPDDSTVEMELAREVNGQIVLSYLQPKYLSAHPGTYHEFVERLDDADDEDQRLQIEDELTSLSVPDPVGSGIMQFEDADSQRTLVSKFEDHPDADTHNIPEMEYLYMPSNQKRWNALINNQTDGSATLFMPANKVDQLPDSVQISLIPRHWGLGLVFNHEAEPVNDRRVRQALAHVINRELVAKNSGAGTNSKIAVKYPTGLTGEFNNQIEGAWLKNVAEEFDTYSFGSSGTDAASELLQEAGYSKDGDTWVDDNGDALSIPIKAPAGFSDWVAGAQTIVSQLKRFGIQAELLSKDTGTYWGKDYANGDFTVALQGWANYNQTYPYFHYEWIYTSGDSTDIWNTPSEFDVDVLHDAVREETTLEPSTMLSQLETAESE